MVWLELVTYEPFIEFICHAISLAHDYDGRLLSHLLLNYIIIDLPLRVVFGVKKTLLNSERLK